MIDLTRIQNPMDWRAIDRFILLAALVLLLPVLMGSSIAYALIFAPEYLVTSYALALLGLYAVHIIVLGWMIYSAFQKRNDQDDWPLFESVIIWSYVINVLVSTFVSGTYLTQGLLLLFLGVCITAALSDINKIRKAYWWVIFFIGIKTSYDLAHPGFDSALFAKPLADASGAVPWGWSLVEIVLSGILMGLIYLCTSAFKRWGEREELLRKMSKIDGLTQLTNRRTLINQGDRILERGLRENNQHKAWLACIMLDLDHFKSINDTWGHGAGDAVLIEVSKVMRETVRCYDEVGRYGGEEFCILMPSSPPKCTLDIAERLRSKIEALSVPYGATRIKVTASLGVASVTYAKIGDLNNLLKLADDALYFSKNGGRNRVTMSKEGRTDTQTEELAAV